MSKDDSQGVDLKCQMFLLQLILLWRGTDHFYALYFLLRLLLSRMQLKALTNLNFHGDDSRFLYLSTSLIILCKQRLSRYATSPLHFLNYWGTIWWAKNNFISRSMCPCCTKSTYSLISSRLHPYLGNTKRERDKLTHIPEGCIILFAPNFVDS